jgi:hypothetical protein
VARWRRAVPIGFAAAPIVGLTAIALLILPTLLGFMMQNQEMITLLEALHRPVPPPGSQLENPEYRTAMETYLVGRFSETLRDDAFWNSPIMKNLADRRNTAREILERHPTVSAEELARATTIVEAGRARAGRRRQDDRGIAGPIVGALGMISLLFVLLLSLASSLILPGGLMARFLGMAVVTRDGMEISRMRSLARTTVAWSPAIAWLFYLLTTPKLQGWVPSGPLQVPLAVIALGVVGLGAIWSIVSPIRGPHDRIVGTWVVPR